MNINATSRRKFLKVTGMTAAGWIILPSWAKNYGAPFVQGYPKHNIPIDKHLDPKWIESLYERGMPTTYLKSKNELKYIGMPVGGLHSGTLYLGGDGRLWLWEIYNDSREGIDPKTVVWNDGTKDRNIQNREGANYVSPTIADNQRVLAQGFAVKILNKGHLIIKELRQEDWDEVSFEATYPLAKVTYTCKDLPIKVILTAGAFFIPLSVKDSELPATSIHILVENISSQNIEVSIVGWLENGVNKITAKSGDGNRQNSLIKNENYLAVSSSFKTNSENAAAQRDAGTMCLTLIGSGGIGNTSASPFPINENLFTEKNNLLSQKDAGEKLIGSIATQSAVMKAGKSLEAN